MRGLNIALFVLMLVFAAVQFNDPDALLWAAYYGVPAAWAWVAAFRRPLLGAPTVRLALGATLLVGVAVVIAYWPPMPDFWRTAVWTEQETAREGMGLMVAFVALLAAAAASAQRG